MKKLPSDFKELSSNPELWNEVMEYNCSSGTYEQWEGKRKFIAGAINGDGTILDIGCAGGMFLKSLQNWSQFELVPYGIDIDESYIEAAKNLFPECPDHFAVRGLADAGNLASAGLPERYDFVYVSVIYNVKWVEFIKNTLLPMAKKRLVLGFYAPNKFEFESEGWKQERAWLAEIIQSLKDAGLECSEPVFNPDRFNQSYVWIDKE
ncbi:MAG: hypothetical protein JWM20_901 [Patescibacteria group bacterium]|nr:hypothetical protein [Patescibacteria group bacterium]